MTTTTQGRLERNHSTAQKVALLIEEEASLHEQHAAILTEERKALKAFKTESVQAWALERERIVDRLQGVQDAYKAVLKSFPQPGRHRISDIVRNFFHPDDVSRIMPLIERVKKIRLDTRREGSEFAQVARFSMGLINSTLSILRSATETIVKTYTRSGLSKESVVPTSAQRAKITREA